MARRKATRRKPKTARVRITLRDVFELGLVITMLALLVWAVYWLRNPASLPIRHVHVQGSHSHIAPETIRDQFRKNGVSGFFATDLRAIEAALKDLPWLKAASVKRQWPDTLIVKIREQVPIARWGSDALLNSDGEIFTPEEIQGFAELPVVYGPLDQRKDLVERFGGINRMLHPVGLNLRALAQDERRAWHLLLDNGIPVALGREEPDMRIQRFVRGFSQVIAARAEQIAAIDLRYTNGFSVAWRENEDNNPGRETNQSQ